jgi:CHASE1-domain containing sensor protein
MEELLCSLSFENLYILLGSAILTLAITATSYGITLENSQNLA